MKLQLLYINGKYTSKAKIVQKIIFLKGNEHILCLYV